MRTRSVLVLTVLMAASALFLGCRQRLQVTVPVDLDEALGTFDVTAGEAVQHRATSGVPQSAINIGSGSITIDPDDITVTPADGGGGKGGVNLQADELIITAWIDDVDAIDTVCETGEEYGPFTVELDDDLNAVSVDPSSVALTQNTIDLFNEGEFSLCLEVLSPVDGTVTIESLTLRLGL